MREARTFQVDFDQCAFGAASMKPTRILMSHQRLQAGLARKCPGNHVHEVLKGKVWSDQFGKVVFRTKLAQVYPHAMCSQMAFDIEALWSRPLEHFAPSFSLASNEDRKRPIGQKIVWKEHKQHNTALAAVASGYQLKRGALKPLLEIETSQVKQFSGFWTFLTPSQWRIRCIPLYNMQSMQWLAQQKGY